ncbi:hypothetical protein SBA2_20041 [Acidobacteriia bacterium SbA2]|nr:hypothetical protein SBA2_20041 [Acidobacteriia bacterium SbA2]
MCIDRIRKEALGFGHSSLRTLDTHVIPAKAGIHCVPDQQWPPAFAGVTTHLVFVSLGASVTDDHSE